MFTIFKYFIIPIITKSILKVIGISNSITRNVIITDISLKNCYILDNVYFQKDIKGFIFEKTNKDWCNWFG